MNMNIDNNEESLYKIISLGKDNSVILSLTNPKFDNLSVELSEIKLVEGNSDVPKMNFSYSTLDDIDESLIDELELELEKIINQIIDDSLSLLSNKEYSTLVNNNSVDVILETVDVSK